MGNLPAQLLPRKLRALPTQEHLRIVQSQRVAIRDVVAPHVMTGAVFGDLLVVVHPSRDPFVGPVALYDRIAPGSAIARECRLKRCRGDLLVIVDDGSGLMHVGTAKRLRCTVDFEVHDHPRAHWLRCIAHLNAKRVRPDVLAFAAQRNLHPGDVVAVIELHPPRPDGEMFAESVVHTREAYITSCRRGNAHSLADTLCDPPDAASFYCVLSSPDGVSLVTPVTLTDAVATGVAS